MARRRMPTARGLQRKILSRTPSRVIIIVCEGKTEKGYLETLARSLRRTGVKVKIAGQRGCPMRVATEANDSLKALRRRSRQEHRRSPQAYEAWAVCDRDGHSDFGKASDFCSSHRIGFAWSTPCVEIWALLFFQDQSAHIKARDCQRRLATHMPRYNHDKRPLFDSETLTESGRKRARSRAIHLHRRAEEAGHPRGNPTTALWKLVDVLVEGSSQKARELAERLGDGSSRWWLKSDPD